MDTLKKITFLIDIINKNVDGDDRQQQELYSKLLELHGRIFRAASGKGLSAEVISGIRRLAAKSARSYISEDIIKTFIVLATHLESLPIVDMVIDNTAAFMYPYEMIQPGKINIIASYSGAGESTLMKAFKESNPIESLYKTTTDQNHFYDGKGRYDRTTNEELWRMTEKSKADIKKSIQKIEANVMISGIGQQKFSKFHDTVISQHIEEKSPSFLHKIENPHKDFLDDLEKEITTSLMIPKNVFTKEKEDV